MTTIAIARKTTMAIPSYIQLRNNNIIYINKNMRDEAIEGD